MAAEDPGIQLVLEELRDLRVEMRADRQRSDEEWRREWHEERTRSDERFGQLMSEMKLEFRELREESARRDAAMQKAFTGAFKQVHTVGLAIVKTLTRHTQILERIDRRLAAPGNGRRGRDNGRGR